MRRRRDGWRKRPFRRDRDRDAIFTRFGVERISRTAFTIAQPRPRKRPFLLAAGPFAD
jgi:isocitrate/isopropylmalate dehydrogenase